MSERSSFEALFKGRRFEPDVIIVAVRWYLRYKLSYRDIVKMMAEREISVDPSTILRWVRAFSPGFEKKRQRFARFIDPSRRVDETYLRVAGEWTYRYRGVDRRGRSTLSYLSRRRTVGAMKAYLRKASRMHKRRPRTVTLDGYAASHRAVREFSEEHPPGTPIVLRSSKDLHTLIEQDPRAIKSRTGPMLGFKDFASAKVTLAGVELLHRMEQGQFALGKLGVDGKAEPPSRPRSAWKS